MKKLIGILAIVVVVFGVAILPKAEAAVTYHQFTVGTSVAAENHRGGLVFRESHGRNFVEGANEISQQIVGTLQMSDGGMCDFLINIHRDGEVYVGTITTSDGTIGRFQGRME